MKRARHTAERIIRKLKNAEQLIAQGKTVFEVCHIIEVTPPLPGKLTPLHPDHFSPGGLMEQSDASLQRCGQG